MRLQRGVIAKQASNLNLPLEVCNSAAGYYIGTIHSDQPFSRESLEYFDTLKDAERALETGDWTQIQVSFYAEL